MDLSLSDRSMVVCFEGWDAAGKGSCIKHLCHALNPRGYEVFQTKAPTEEESRHTYLWRFCKGIPTKGHITVYDRTWYGRMMVEHIEGFCTEEEYRRSPIEINTLEKIMVNNGAILLKFWLDITPEEQLRRFKKRADDPLKQWKITEEDWRNRAKWDEYDSHVDAMIESTNTDRAPWTVVDSNNKKHSRITVLKTVVDVLREELGQRPP
jgi:polyphosphate kinase 2 (PPK2 family)